MDSIFALSSGAPPAGIGVIRLTGPQARDALIALTGALPSPRKAARAQFRDAAGDLLDDGLVLFFPGPHSVTGEDLAEFHCHGGRAVVAALHAALARIPGCRAAEPGEFTRRAFRNGRIDLAEAEGLGDLLAAETELQRRVALDSVRGLFSAQVGGWREALLRLSAQLEAQLDFSDEADVADLPPAFHPELAVLGSEIAAALAAPHAELLREGFRVALAGPPNAGKSTLFNALVRQDAAITAALAGTTRDVLIRLVALDGVPFSFIDMAGLRDAAGDEIEAIGIGRARQEIAAADLVLWLGGEGQGPAGSWEIAAQCDRPDADAKAAPRHRVSALSEEGMAGLRADLVATARAALPKPGTAALNRSQRQRLATAHAALERAGNLSDHLLLAEELRLARASFDALLGRTATEDVLDAVFGRFCIGK